MAEIYCDAYGHDMDESECENCAIRKKTGFSVEKCPFGPMIQSKKFKLEFNSEKDRKDFEKM